MSTKIYGAWRTPIANLNAVLRALQASADRVVAAHVKPILQACDRLSSEGFRGFTSHDFWNLVAQSQRTPERAHMEEAGLWVYLDVPNGLAYLRIYGPYWLTEHLNTREVPGVEDYHYQNSTDRPQGVSEEAWEQRSRDWERVMGRQGEPALPALTCDLFDLSPRTGPHSVTRRIELAAGAGDDYHWANAEKKRGKEFTMDDVHYPFKALNEVNASKREATEGKA